MTAGTYRNKLVVAVLALGLLVASSTAIRQFAGAEGEGMGIEAPSQVAVGQQFTVIISGMYRDDKIAVMVGSDTFGWGTADATGVAKITNAVWAEGAYILRAKFDGTDYFVASELQVGLYDWQKENGGGGSEWVPEPTGPEVSAPQNTVVEVATTQPDVTQPDVTQPDVTQPPVTQPVVVAPTTDFISEPTTQPSGSGTTQTPTTVFVPPVREPLQPQSTVAPVTQQPVTPQPPTSVAVVQSTVAPNTVTEPLSDVPRPTKPIEPESTQPQSTQPETTRPATTRPATSPQSTTQPVVNEPASTQPDSTDFVQPATSQSPASQPSTTQPAPARPTTTPVTTRPAPTTPLTISAPAKVAKRGAPFTVSVTGAEPNTWLSITGNGGTLRWVKSDGAGDASISVQWWTPGLITVAANELVSGRSAATAVAVATEKLPLRTPTIENPGKLTATVPASVNFGETFTISVTGLSAGSCVRYTAGEDRASDKALRWDCNVANGTATTQMQWWGRGPVTLELTEMIHGDEEESTLISFVVN
jgi:hypothetical protein